MVDKIRVGMIGVGGIAQGHIDRLLKLPEVEIVALADSSQKSIERTQGKHSEGVKNAAVFADYRQLLETAKPDAVVICTPHTQHFQQAVGIEIGDRHLVDLAGAAQFVEPEGRVEPARLGVDPPVELHEV